MLKKKILIISVCFNGFIAQGQSLYKDSIHAYQLNYKKDLYNIIKNDTAYVRFYTINHSYKVTARIERLYSQSFFPMATSNGGSKQAVKFASVKFRVSGKEFILFAYQLSSLLSSDDNKDYFFIPFTDSTSGTDSYGGGRYMDFKFSDIQNNKLVIDFNKAYNPYCAFKSGYNCPVPPAENDLRLAIKAGEMNFGKAPH